MPNNLKFVYRISDNLKRISNGPLRISRGISESHIKTMATKHPTRCRQPAEPTTSVSSDYSTDIIIVWH